MEKTPYIPSNSKNHDVANILSEMFQETLTINTYPQNIADNINKYHVDESFSLKDTAEEVKKINEEARRRKMLLWEVEKTLMIQTGTAFMKKEDADPEYKNKILFKYKPNVLLPKIHEKDKEAFGLLEKKDLYPSRLEQAIDFRYSTDVHNCKSCELEDTLICQKTKINFKQPYKPTICKNPSFQSSSFTFEQLFTTSTKEIKFEANFELGKTYKAMLSLKNIYAFPKHLYMTKPPESKQLSVSQYKKFTKIAPGMTVTIIISFIPREFRNFTDSITFSVDPKANITIPIVIRFEAPKLNIMVVKKEFRQEGMPEETREVLSNTINFGGCFIKERIPVSLIIENQGRSGVFYIVTEDEWQNSDLHIKLINKSDEFIKGQKHFWIYPNFFKIDEGETIEISVLYYPKSAGEHRETYYLLCCNNAHHEIEFVGEGVVFDKYMLTVDVVSYQTGINHLENHCIYCNVVHDGDIIEVPFAISNSCNAPVTCLWQLNNKDRASEEIIPLDKMDILYGSNKVPAGGTIRFSLKIIASHVSDKYYGTYLSLFACRIPLDALKEETEHVIEILENVRDCNEETMYVHVRAMEVELIYYGIVHTPKKEELERRCECVSLAPPELEPKMMFNCDLLDFGWIPLGIERHKEIRIYSLSNELVPWKIIEIYYNLDAAPYMEICSKKNFSPSSGVLCECQSIIYKVRPRVSKRWVSILLLYQSSNSFIESTPDSICVVTYESIKSDIFIKTDHPVMPILCPLKLLFVDLPSNYKIVVENRGLLTSCYYFLPVTGEHADKLSLKIDPKCGILQPNEKISVDIEIIALDVGIFDEIFVPCFIGAHQNPLILRILLAVDNIHVNIYLPHPNGETSKILWPPKLTVENDYSDSYCPCESPPVSINPESGDSIGADRDLQLTCTDLYSTSDVPNLEEELEDNFEDLMLQEHVVELYHIPIRTVRKFTIYIENVTPKSANYLIEAINYPPNDYDPLKDVDQKMLMFAKLTNKEDIFKKCCNNTYGIVVKVEAGSGSLEKYQTKSIEIWIYANTWGTYLEEIMIEMSDSPTFCFSLIIEIIGLPLEFPMAKNAVTEMPVIRFGKIPFQSKMFSREVKIINSGVVPVMIQWHVFLVECSGCKLPALPFNVVLNWSYEEVEPMIELTDFYGYEKQGLVEVFPRKIKISPQETVSFNVMLNPKKPNEDLKKNEMKCIIIGYLSTLEEHRLKNNYFYRKSGIYLTPVKLLVVATLEKPPLLVDGLYGETKFTFYATELIQEEVFSKEIKLLFSNKNTNELVVYMHVEEPFRLVELYTTYSSSTNGTLSVSAGEKLKANLMLYITKKDVFNLSKNIYDSPGDKNVNSEENSITIKRHLNIHQNHASAQTLLLEAKILFPKIKVVPRIVKLNQVVLCDVKKTFISVYNLSGAAVNIKILLPLDCRDIMITPQIGSIKPKRGVNNEFTNFFITFRPRTKRVYSEIIRIETDFDNYFIDVPVIGMGAVNQRFLTTNLL